PASGQRADALRPRGLPDVFYDDIHATLVRQPFDLLGDVLPMVVDDLERPHRTGALELVGGPRGREHARAVEYGDLDRRLADPAAGRKHEHVFAACQPGPR